jgi:branched-chain amino acid transport system ATP-binding protein
MADLLELRNVHFFYHHIHALKGITLKVREGEVVCIIGGNGAGKTTTLSIISGILKPKHGTVLMDGMVINTMRPEERVGQGIAHVYEGRRLFTRLTVEANLCLGAYQRQDSSEIRKDLEKMYNEFPVLKERRHQHAGSLSGGEQQMVAIARALMSRPVLLLLDEPSMGLAPKIVGQVFRIIEMLKSQGITILLVEQNARQALAVADRGYLLENGKVVLQGTQQELRSHERVQEAYLGKWVGKALNIQT